MSNADIDQFILDNLPATFATLYEHGDVTFGVDTFRRIDARLQALRKRGLIAYTRQGRFTVWEMVK